MARRNVRGKVLVTGGAGFIGSRLVKELLTNGLKVKVLDVQRGPFKKEADPGLEFVEAGKNPLVGGMLDKSIVKEAIRGVDVVYHLAINWDGHSWRHKLPTADLFDANIRGTLNLLEEARSQRVRHFLFSSSIAVYGEDPGPVSEEGVCKPELWNGDPGPAYGIVKFATERLCLMYHHHYGLPATAFRIDLVFSDNDELYVNKQMVDKVHKNKPIEVSRGRGSSSIHVDDVVHAFLLATLNRKAYGRVFNLSNPIAYLSDYEIYRFLLKTTGSQSKVTFSKSPRKHTSVMSTREAGKLLGWKPYKGRVDRKKAIASFVRSISRPGWE